MSFSLKVIIFDSAILFISIFLIFYLYRTIIRGDKKYINELVDINLKQAGEISKLDRKIDLLNNIIKNNEYDINKDYESINYIADDKHELYKADGVIYMSEGYTDDISKAKNFVKINTAYYEVKRKDN